MGNISLLEDEKQRLLDIAIAKRTHVTYSAAWNKFKIFCTTFERPLQLPISVQDLSLFIAYLSKSGCSSSTAATYISGLAYEHKLKGFPDFSNCFIIKKLVEGLARDNGRKPDSRLPITASYLALIMAALDNICSSEYEATLFKAAFSLSFFGFLRIGEVAAQSKSNVPAHVLLKHDVSIQEVDNEQAIIINFRVSKNNQCGVPQSVLILKQANQSICPVQSLNCYLSQASNSPFMFAHFDGSPITRFQFSSILLKAVTFCNLPNHELYKSHSFRIGAATTAKMAGYSDKDIQLMGRWRSNVFKKYIRIPVLQ